MTAVYFFAAILAVLLVAVLVAPLLDSEPSPGRSSEPSERLAAALEALRELEFEHETGKIGDADYREMRAACAAEAIAARDAGAAVQPDAGREERASSCPVCGARTTPDAKFCSRCGTAVRRGGPGNETGGDAA